LDRYSIFLREHLGHAMVIMETESFMAPSAETAVSDSSAGA
jgi:hypothetical protein